MQNLFRKTMILALILSIASFGALFAQGMGGDQGHGGGHGGGGHHGGGHGGGWGHGDSTGCDSSGFGGHHGGGFGDGWWHGDSTAFDSIFVTGIVSTALDTFTFGGGHGHSGGPDSAEFVHTSYYLDVDDDDSADYRLVRLFMLGHHDSTFVLPVDGDMVSVSGYLRTLEDELDRIIVFGLAYEDAESYGSLLATAPVISNATASLQSTNYPNPFNPSTMIEFSLGQASQTTLKIYDIRGVEVATLIDQYYAAGVHTLQFSPKGLSAGTYLYVLASNGQREVGRLAYLK